MVRDRRVRGGAVVVTLETQAAFAERLGKHKSHVTRLKKGGRLVLCDGLVDVEKSLALIGSTASTQPHHVANTMRLEGDRVSRETTRAEVSPDIGDRLADLAYRQKSAQLRKSEADARVAEIERDKLEGTVCDVDEVNRVGKRWGNLVQRAWIALADRLAPELAVESDPAACRAIILEHAEASAEDLANETVQLEKAFKAEGEK